MALRLGDILVERIVEASQALLCAAGIGVEDTIPIAAVGTPEVDDVAVVEYIAVLLIERHPFFDEGLGFLRIE